MNINPYEPPREFSSDIEAAKETVFDFHFTLTQDEIERAIATYQSVYFPAGPMCFGLFVLFLMTGSFLVFSSVRVPADWLEIAFPIFMVGSILSAIGLTLIVLRIGQIRMQRSMESRFGIRARQPIRMQIQRNALSLATMKTTAEFPLRQSELLMRSRGNFSRNYLIVSPSRGLVIPIPRDAQCNDGLLNDVVDLVCKRFSRMRT